MLDTTPYKNLNKICEYCGKKFVVNWRRREVSFCSRKCSSHYAYRTPEVAASIFDKIKDRQKRRRIQQIDIYSKLKKSLGRDPQKREWEEECSKCGVPHRIRSRRENCKNPYAFNSYKELKEAANLNFKVVSVEECGYEDVYNGLTPVGYYDGSTHTAYENGTPHESYQTEDDSSPYGVRDMAGNVWEWCEDTYLVNSYKKYSGENALVRESGVTDLVIRGGSWYSRPRYVRCASRDHLHDSRRRGNDVGFRLVMKP